MNTIEDKIYGSDLEDRLLELKHEGQHICPICKNAWVLDKFEKCYTCWGLPDDRGYASVKDYQETTL